MIISFVVYEIWVRILSCKRATSVENIVHCVLNTVIPVQYNDLWLYNKFLIVHISSIYSRTTSDKNNNSKPPYPLPGPNSNQINAYTHTHTPLTLAKISPRLTMIAGEAGVVQVVDGTVQPGLTILERVSPEEVHPTWNWGPLAAVSVVPRITTADPSGQLTSISLRAQRTATTSGRKRRGNFEDD